MASRTLKSTSSTQSTPSSAVTPDTLTSLSQNQLQTAMGLSNVMLKGAEEMRRCQMDVAHQARERHDKLQTSLGKVHTAAELFELQSELLRFDMQMAARYWQDLGSVVAATNADLLSACTRAAASWGGEAAKFASQPVALSVAAPAHAIPTNGADMPAQAWTQWVDLSKQWADMLYRTEAALH